ncbi:TetR/AcrR family transcriptional regulator [Staphylococcus carnosus]|uniref:Transcriptional regulator n=1 Tax=Staphylococcus carnosus (strain TM300) TaxID=396513 RepID=B9DL50_STACT|nr:TetR family transcriptional regulator [Staphylococcus carnosus]QPT04912.1 TetR/AcrR family transcriptional regulator [Staphylococcus carnosus]UQA67637.1 TetR family transcriptional regulator [Staphylococcus carnosus]UTB77536.1 transcriptional regulator [Staphylococcus carnosus]UTB87080.1 transcriptional regulator [Staphylococcus carnosus]UTB89430.1 transcriptional regulator [Staphylococcus carnosus]
MAGRPKDPKINTRIYEELGKLLDKQPYSTITIDELAENTQISKATIYRRWKDKDTMIIDMFLNEAHGTSEIKGDFFNDLYALLLKMTRIYTRPLGKAVIQILLTNSENELRNHFMVDYFNEYRQLLRSIASTRIPEDQQDIFIDLIFSPIYFNILIKPETLTDEYIHDMLTTVIRSYIPDGSF